MTQFPKKPLIMGILNVTPDSFSDGGLHNEFDQAITHVRNMISEGADIIDVGGESTRPGSERVSVEEQLQRTIDIIAECRKKIPENIDISIDTTRSQVAEQALNNGASIINDVTAGTDDPDILMLAAERKVPISLMHMQGRPSNMQENPHYDDVVEEIRTYLLQRVEEAVKAGVDESRIILDPGIGFGKTKEHNLIIMNSLNRFTETGFSVLLGTSRKRFMGSICQVDSPSELVAATCATTVLGIQQQVRIFRVHDVKENRQAADVAWEILNVSPN